MKLRHKMRFAHLLLEAPRSTENIRDLIGRIDEVTWAILSLQQCRTFLSRSIGRERVKRGRSILARCERDLHHIEIYSHAALGLAREAQNSLTARFSLREILKELDACEREYDVEYSYSFGGQPSLSIDTEPIEFDGVELGSFKIVLWWNTTTKDWRLICIAHQPNHPIGNDHVTHPHVNDDRLCTGEMGPAIALALEQGAVFTFFQLVESVLNNYDPDAAYVQIDQWHGSPCVECGTSISHDDGFVCPSCDEFVCEDCTSVCIDCGRRMCIGCTLSCCRCDDPVCGSCWYKDKDDCYCGRCWDDFQFELRAEAEKAKEEEEGYAVA